MADDLAGLLAAGERAAFHGRPAAGVEPLRRAVDIAAGDGLVAEAAAAGWLLGVCLASAGRYGGALSNVPKRLSSASLALGATPWQTAIRVVLPTASPGIFSASAARPFVLHASSA